MTSLIPLDYQDGAVSLTGMLARPQGEGPHPAVLVMHNAMGLGVQVRERAEALAARGYVALASDMYGGAAVFTEGKDAGAHMGPLVADHGKLRARAMAGLDALTAQPGVDTTRVAAIGFCFGGQCVLELARAGAPLKAAVSYHGLLTTQKAAEPGAVKPELVVFTGGKDPYAPAEDVATLRAEMVAAGARWQITEFGDGYHAFTDPDAEAIDAPGLKYDPLLDAISWAATLALLDRTLH
jgi:dienelactone hydrolase